MFSFPDYVIQKLIIHLKKAFGLHNPKIQIFMKVREEHMEVQEEGVIHAMF